MQHEIHGIADFALTMAKPAGFFLIWLNVANSTPKLLATEITIGKKERNSKGFTIIGNCLH